MFRATGNAAVLTGSGNTNNDNRNSIFIGSSSWVVFHGLKVYSSLRAGVRVSLSHHVTIQGCVFGNHQKWGIFTDYADDLSLLGNECFGSIDEHGIYHSNSSDRGVISGNWCHDNNASGIQINADPDFLAPIGGYVPDGISSYCVVERNFLQDNGVVGGAAINLASVRNCVIRNNVIVNDAWINSTGIALWDNGAGIQWGCKDNLIEHNTVAYTSQKGRYAIGFMNGSTGNTIRDNVLRGGRRGAIAFTADSLSGLTCDYNVLFSVDNWPIVVQDDVVYVTFTLAQWQGLGFDAHSFHANPAFTNEAGNDLSLLPGSPGPQHRRRRARPDRLPEEPARLDQRRHGRVRAVDGAQCVSSRSEDRLLGPGRPRSGARPRRTGRGATSSTPTAKQPVEPAARHGLRSVGSRSTIFR